MEILRIKEPGLMAAIYRLRVVAWANEGVSLPVAADGSFHEAIDDSAEHYGIVVGKDVVGAVRLSHHDSVDTLGMPDISACGPLEAPIALLSRLVVHPNWQHRGYGSSLTHHSATLAKADGARTLVAYVTVPGIAGALNSHGLTEVGRADVPWGDQSLDAQVLVLRR